LRKTTRLPALARPLVQPLELASMESKERRPYHKGVLTHAEIGRMPGISKPRVQQIEKSAVRKLRRSLAGIAKGNGDCNMTATNRQTCDPRPKRKSRKK
jgi:hypothetical protein